MRTKPFVARLAALAASAAIAAGTLVAGAPSANAAGSNNLNVKAGEYTYKVTGSPKAGWVRFRWSRTVPDARSFRVKLDRAGRWHVSFAAIPAPIEGPGTGEVVGVDRGITVSAALSTGEMLTCPRRSPSRQRRLTRLQRKLARARGGSNRRAQVKFAIARPHGRLLTAVVDSLRP